jgi:hypothetical protein
LEGTVNIPGPVLEADYRRAKEEFPFIEAVERAHGLPALLLYAVGSRETNLRNIKGDFTMRPGETSKRFHGFGVWQRDSAAFGVDESYLKDVHKQAEDAAELLAANFRTFERWNAAVAAYNCGVGNVKKALANGQSVDHFTAHQDYSADVLARHHHLVVHVGEKDLSIEDDDTKNYLDRQFESIRDRMDRALQRVGGTRNSVYNNDNQDFRDLVMSEEVLAAAKAAKETASKLAHELARIRDGLGIR